jgi:hypothetical protein
MTTGHARRDECGAMAVLMALVAVVLFGFAALAVDVAQVVDERQELHDALDSAVQSGAGRLPADGSGALDAALDVAERHGARVLPTVDFFCVVGSLKSGTSYVVDTTHIPLTCNPGPAPYTAASYPNLTCNERICAIPCVPSQGDQCNTIRASDELDVPFVFAPILGIDAGSTGLVTSVACQGPCGTIPANPIDLVVVGDRTGSMGGMIRNLEDAVENLLEYLTPAQHRVALGTIGRSLKGASADCPSKPSRSRSEGPWIPVGFSGGYDTTDVQPPSRPPVLNPNDPVARAADCLGNENSNTGTYLAAPMRAAHELLTGSTARPAPVRKAIIFMTDGEPNESTNPGIGYPYSSNGTTACTNAVNEAAAAKTDGILVVTIAFRLENVRCASGSGPYVTERLATMASPRSDGTPSRDDGGGEGAGCNTAAEVAGENADGDYFFCTPSPDDLAPIFQSAAASIVQSTRLIRLP